MEDKEQSRLSRLTAILTHLQSKRISTAPELAKKFSVSVRTIYRDIRSLEASGIPIYTEEGRGYSMLDGYRLPPVMFTEEEANALITGFKMISRNKDGSLVKNYNDAITKIKAVLKSQQKDKVDLLSNRVAIIQNYSKSITSNILSTVQIAITGTKLIEIKYKSLYKDEMSIRRVEAQALYHTQENWILIAWCHLRKDMREFRLDRIVTIKMLDTLFDDRQFDLHTYFKSQVK